MGMRGAVGHTYKSAPSALTPGTDIVTLVYLARIEIGSLYSSVQVVGCLISSLIRRGKEPALWV